ncbi:MAG: nucleotidyltransferase family protein [Abditibacteriaceae bacterium]
MDAIILAGGEIPSGLRESLSPSILESAHGERALLPLQGRPAIAWLLESLHDVEDVDHIIVVGQMNTLELLPQWSLDAIGVPAQDTLSANVLAGIDAAQSSLVLLMTCDIPLATSQTWNDFLAKVSTGNWEAAYPIVRSETMERIFPGGKRTYATVTDGKFTGGNAFVLPRSCRPALEKVLETAYNARKNPLKLAGLLGIRFIIKAVTKRLSIADVEKKISKILNCRAGAVEMQDAAIAFDIDKSIDYNLVESTFAKRDKMCKKD